VTYSRSNVRFICLVIALIKCVPTVDVWVKCVLETACCQLYFFETLAQKATLYSEKPFKTLFRVLIQLLLEKNSNQNKMSYFTSCWSFHLNLIPKEKYTLVFAPSLFSLPFPSVKRREKKIQQNEKYMYMKNSRKHQSNLSYDFGFVKSKTKKKYIQFFCFLSSKRRNK